MLNYYTPRVTSMSIYRDIYVYMYCCLHINTNINIYRDLYVYDGKLSHISTNRLLAMSFAGVCHLFSIDFMYSVAILH